MAAADYTSLVQSLYISYFGRPADTLGLANFSAALDALHAPTDAQGLASAYITTPALKSIIDSFGTSAESVALYGTDTLSFVSAVYMNVLNRAADFSGLLYWAGEIDSGRLTKANASLAILAGATSNTSAQGLIDAAVVANKVAVATAFTDSIDLGTELSAYTGDAAAATARDMMHLVNESTTVAGFQATIDATLVALVEGNVVTNTVNLTSGVDTIVGATGNQIFQATDTTYTGLDTIDGGAGNDKLVISDVAGGIDLGLATVVNVETLQVTSTGGLGAAADLSAWTGLESATFVTKGTAVVDITADAGTDISVSNTGNAAVTIEGGADVTITTGDAAVAVTGTGGLTSVTLVGGTTVAIDDDGEGTLTSVSLNSNNNGATIAADMLTSLTIANTAQSTTVTADAGERALALNLNKVTAAAVVSDLTATSIAITTSGTASSITLNTDMATALTIAGDKGLTLALDEEGVEDGEIESIVSTSTGAVTITTALGDDMAYTGAGGVDTIEVGATNVAIDTGAGNDVVTVSVGALGEDGTIAAGEGDADVLSMDTANAAAASSETDFAAQISGFEVLNLGAVAASATDTIDLDNMDGISYVVTAGGAAGSASTPAVAEVRTVTLAGNANYLDQITFDGQTTTFADGDTPTQAAAKIAAKTYVHYTVTAAAGVLTITDKVAADVVDMDASAFVLTNGLAIGKPTLAAPVNTVQGVDAAAAVPPTSEVQNMLVAGPSTGPVSFLGAAVAGTVGGQSAADVITAILADSANIIATWNAANPSRELLSIAAGAGVDDLDLTYALTEGDVIPMPGAISNGISFGNATTTTPGNAGTAAIVAVGEQFTVTVSGVASGADEITFAGTTIALADHADATAIAADIAATVNADGANIWHATSAGAVVTFIADTDEDRTDAVAGDFVVTDITADAVTQSIVVSAPTTAGANAFVGTAGNLVLTNMVSGGTVEITGNGQYNVGVKSASTGTADVLNVALVADGDLAAGELTVASVETINIALSDDDTDTPDTDSLTLIATGTKTVVVTGDKGLTLTNTGNTKITTFDASGVTAVDGDTAAAAVVFTSANTTASASVTIKGGAGDDILTGNAGSDTIVGGAGDDVLSGLAGVNSLTGGAGDDEFVMALSESAVKASTITDLAADDMITLSAAIIDVDGEMGAAVTGLDASTAVFQDWVDAAVASVDFATNNVAWFQFGGNTYIVQDLVANSATFTNGDDNIVKITGTVDLTDSTIAGSTITIV